MIELAKKCVDFLQLLENIAWKDGFKIDIENWVTRKESKPFSDTRTKIEIHRNRFRTRNPKHDDSKRVLTPCREHGIYLLRENRSRFCFPFFFLFFLQTYKKRN